MPVLTVAIAVAIGIVLLLRKARFHYERLPKIPYASGAQFGEVAIVVPERFGTREKLTTSAREKLTTAAACR